MLNVCMFGAAARVDDNNKMHVISKPAREIILEQLKGIPSPKLLPFYKSISIS